MDILELFNDQDNKYTDLFENAIFNEILNIHYQKPDHVEKIILTTINAKLERVDTQCQALNLLVRFIFKIQKENLIKYFPYWTGKVVQIFKNVHSDSEELILVCKAIEAFIATCKKIPELDKRISIYIVKQLLNIIDEQYFHDKNETLINLLIVLLYNYPESCARFQTLLNPIITSCIDDKKTFLAISGAKCYSLLVRAMERSFLQMSKNKSIIEFDTGGASCHIFYQINLCNYLYEIIKELFHDVIIDSFKLPYNYQNIINIQILQISKISCDNILKYYTSMENRFTNICIYLSTLLKVGSTEKKKFALPSVILQVICQGLSITPKNLNKDIGENKKDLLLLILPKLHIGLLNVLESLIISFQQELLPFSLTIQRIILQTLKWTKEYLNESYKNIKILSYKILSLWLCQVRSLSGFQLIADEFLPHIVQDISIIKNNVLVLNVKPNKNLTKNKLKHKNSRENENYEDYKIDCKVFNYSNSILCLQVVLAVQSIILHANCFLKPSFYDSIKDTIVCLLYNEYVNKNSLIDHKVITQYRLQLLRTLRILQTNAHNLTPCPTSYAIQMFGIVISQDRDIEVIEEANRGLEALRYMVYPTAPSLMLPISKPYTSYLAAEDTSLKSLNFLEDVNCSQCDVNQISKNKFNNISASNDTSYLDIEQHKRRRLNEENLGTKTYFTTTSLLKK